MNKTSNNHQRKYQTQIFAAILAISGFSGLLGAPIAMAGSTCDSGTDWNGDMDCSFGCLAGETVGVMISGGGSGAWGNASCEGATAECSGAACSDRGTNTAGSDGSGDCSGNADSGAKLTCVGGSGLDEGDSLRVIAELIQGGADCLEIQTLALSLGLSSIVQKEIGETGSGTTVFTWNASDGCPMPDNRILQRLIEFITSGVDLLECDVPTLCEFYYP